ncbi:hypothetical protein QQX98_003568 [Neonectria punicea]|uniref:Alcohol dehydrogenase n=1 Tax=Neonectria punicea TaxID=979145 RepID=A0ABR1HDA5_9HYPO
MSLLNATMRGVVLNGPYTINVTDMPMPIIINQTDAVVRITTSALCGSDLHMYHGYQGGEPGFPMGHEAMGYISEIGSGVSSLSVGDYVVVPDNTATGHIDMGVGTYTNPYGPSFGTGALGGLQAEYARIPYADMTWSAVTWSGFEPGDTVAVFGAGPVGLLAAYSAKLRGASRVYSIDHVPMRLERTASIGAIPINFYESDPVEQILALEPMGVVRVINCVGMEAVNAQGEMEQGIVLNNMVRVVAAHGGIGQIGVYMAQNDTAVAPNAERLSPDVSFPLTEFFTKGLSYHSGIVFPGTVASELVRLIASGEASPHFIESASIGIEEVPGYYERFSRQEEIKIYIHFP